MTTRVDIEEIEATKSEKFLAVVLLAFLLIGTIWFYVKVDAWVPGGPNYAASPAESKAYQAQEATWDRQASAEQKLEQEKSELALAKNDFDIAVAKGGDVASAEADYKKAEVELREAQRQLSDAQVKAKAAEQAVAKFERARTKVSHTGHDWAVAGIRLGFIVGWLLASLRWMSALRRGQSRFLPLGFAAAGAGVITALVYAVDYITDYIDWRDLGPIVLSAAGVAATIGAFIGLQRWLAARIPGRRVRNGECPFCGHPQRGDAPHCEGCGREVIAPCASCGQPRRVGSPHCGACGQE
jgi:hypothetical protein